MHFSRHYLSLNFVTKANSKLQWITTQHGKHSLMTSHKYRVGFPFHNFTTDRCYNTDLKQFEQTNTFLVCSRPKLILLWVCMLRQKEKDCQIQRWFFSPNFRNFRIWAHAVRATKSKNNFDTGLPTSTRAVTKTRLVVCLAV